MNTYRIGIIGCGGIAREHARAYNKIPNTKLVAGSELDAERREKFAKDLNLEKSYENYNEMLKKESLDIVSVCTWPKGHCDAVIQSAKAGCKGIMCEKPMATNLYEADQMLSACRDNNTRLAIGHHHRFDPQLVKAKELIKERAVGEITLLWGHCSLDLMNNGSHVVDMINFLNDDQPAEWVMGQIDIRNKRQGYVNHPDMYAEDMAMGRICYKNGVRATVELGEFAPQNWQFHIIGSDGIIDVNLPDGTPLRMMSKDTNGWVLPKLDPCDPREEEMLELIKAIEEKREHISSGQIGRNGLEIIMAIFESSRNRRLVELPLDIKDNPLESMMKGVSQ
ncbi:TPA: Gfo/Idh/MocA family oxidoreductase [bacterium]|nr:Gfo/Idh/MocA family oxidoreductase [bacterium]